MEFSATFDADNATVVLEGPVGIESVQELKELLLEAIGACVAPGAVLGVDMSGVSEVDVPAMQVFSAACLEAFHRGGAIEFGGAPADIKNAMGLAGFVNLDGSLSSKGCSCAMPEAEG